MMHFFSLLMLWLVALWSESLLVKGTEIDMFRDAVVALSKGLQFMENHVSEINLDGVVGCLLVEGLFDSILESNPGVLDRLGVANAVEELSTKAGRIAEISPQFLKITEPEYYTDLRRLLEKSTVTMWYPSRVTNPSLQVQPVPCSKSVFNETQSDRCLIEILGTSQDKNSACNISKECLEMMTKPRQRGYMITHQVLYFQLVEMHNCLQKSKLLQHIPKSLQDTLCSNVMRDAVEIADSSYPLNHQDLFMEQIGLCGMWGYKDFYKAEWLGKIFQWQKESGCYADRARWRCTNNLRERKIRIKRQEKILKNGCLSHKTAVALLALAANIRFSMENISKTI